MSEKPKPKKPEQLLMPWHPRYGVRSTVVAELLDCSHDTVLRLLQDGSLKGYRSKKKGGSPWRIYFDSVVSHIDKLRAERGLKAAADDDKS